MESNNPDPDQLPPPKHDLDTFIRHDMTDKQTVYIDVTGGVAYLAQRPEGIRVVIWDYDNQKAEEDPSEYEPEVWN